MFSYIIDVYFVWHLPGKTILPLSCFRFCSCELAQTAWLVFTRPVHIARTADYNDFMIDLLLILYLISMTIFFLEISVLFAQRAN